MLNRRRLLGIFGAATAGTALGFTATSPASAVTVSGTIAGTVTDGQGNVTDLSGEVTMSAPSGTVTIDGATATPRYTPYAGEAVIAGLTRISGDWTVDGLTVPAGAVLEFDADSSVTLRSRGNVVVEGVLRMRPATSAQTHRLQFIDINEANFVGGGMEVLASDVGLWVTEAGVLDAVGTPKAGWNRTGQDPTWAATDEVRAAPQAVGDFTTFAPFIPGAAVPSFTHGGRTYAAEVFNLTRNVIIGGTAGGRSHVLFLHGHDTPQTLRFVRFEHVGPRKANPAKPTENQLVPGRYGLHFHHAGDGSRGSLVEGCVVTQGGSRGFVPHGSHGITFRDCVVYDNAQDGYWWDPDTRGSTSTYPANASHDALYDHCAAFKIRPPSGRDVMDNRLAGFHLGQGERNAAIDCVAAGVGNGGVQSSGFNWPESANSLPNTWAFQGCQSHNNERYGTFVWQNDPWLVNDHLVADFDAFRNGRGGIQHGAYNNRYTYRDVRVFDNGGSGSATDTPLMIHMGRRSTFEDMTLAAASLTQSALYIAKQKSTPNNDPMQLTRLSMTGATARAVYVDEQPGDVHHAHIQYLHCTVDGRDLEPSDFHVIAMHPTSKHLVQRRDGSAYQLHPDGSHTAIAPFAA